MTTNRYTIGTLITISGTFSVNGTDMDPTSVELTVKDPSGADFDLSSSVVKDSTGHYHADYAPPTQLGLYQYEWIGTGAVQVTDIGSFLVDQGPL